MRAAGLLLLALLTGPVQAQTSGGTSTALTCGAMKAEASRTGTRSSWTISSPAEKTTETGSLRSGPQFACLDGAVLIVEFTSSAGHSFFGAYFPDGTNIGYGRRQIERRGDRFVLPVQAKARIAEPYRASFDYHCRLNMPADPIESTARADCIF